MVSVIIPVYNCERFISETIRSVIAQSYSNWELIIVDDGSTDSGPEKINFFSSDERIKYFRQNNSGVSAARNKGISLSSGEFIAFLDADDVWEPMNLETKILMLERNDHVDWVFSDMFLLNENGSVRKSAPEGTDSEITKNILLWERDVVPGASSNIVMRKKVLSSIGFDDNLSTAADQDFTLQLSGNFSGMRIPQNLFSYRILHGSMSRNISVMEKDHMYVYSKALKMKLMKGFFFRQRCFSNLYLILAGSWWVDGKNKSRGIYFLVLAILMYPPVFYKLGKKLFQ